MPTDLCAVIEFAPDNAQYTRRMKNFLEEFLCFLKVYSLQDQAVDGGTYDAWSRVYSAASAIFTLPDTVWFVSVIKRVACKLVLLAIRIDRLSFSSAYVKTIDAAGRLSKTAGIAANDRTPAQATETKRAAVLALANLSFRAYFKLNNTRLCEIVLGSVQNALLMNRRNDTADKSGEERYSVAERVTYRYYLGQIRLIQHRVHVGAQHLRWAFDHCTNAHVHNKRKILVPLVASYLILGRYATPALLTRYCLREQYEALLHFHRQGNGAGVMHELEMHREWFRKRGLYMLLREKVQLGVWRNLFRRCLLLTLKASSTSTAPPTLQLAALVAPARLAWADATLELEDMECVAVNLIDQVRNIYIGF